jgi:dienelactone hydrolase
MMNDDKTAQPNRRQIVQIGAAAGMAVHSVLKGNIGLAMQNVTPQTNHVEKNMIGAYGPWAASIVDDGPAALSFLRNENTDLATWKKLAKARVLQGLLQPPIYPVGQVAVESTEIYDGLRVERLSWQLPYGPRTAALLLKPADAIGKLPAVLGLHDHGGMKFFGLDKITRTGQKQHPIIVDHQQSDYGGLPWANELAKRGYVVLVHDTFTFGSRRVLPSDLPPVLTRKLPDVSGNSVESVHAYNDFASDHEHIMAKSLFCAGLTWPGVFLSEDQRALDYLCSRDDVDSQRVGCAGLSGGGLRTAYLAGVDDRIKCACCVGMMTTWRDYLLHKAHTHTWMIYIPGLARDLDYPEILAMRAPLPTLVLSNNDDPLFTLPEMQRATQMMAAIYNKAGATDSFAGKYYPGPHKFDRQMQADAWVWMDRWLKS